MNKLGEFVDQYSNHHQTTITAYQQNLIPTDVSMEVALQIRNNNWGLDSAYISTPNETGLRYNFPESSSDGDITPR